MRSFIAPANKPVAVALVGARVYSRRAATKERRLAQDESFRSAIHGAEACGRGELLGSRAAQPASARAHL
ncbi:MAG: hypothetical protein H6715_04635 [Myxococcales bacterium]|nr:hypothetical protein [Myxococcales bacterium]